MEERILNFINKAQYKLGELGFNQINKSSRSIRKDDKDFKLMCELSTFISYLYESVIPVVKGEENDFNFIQISDLEVLKQIELYEIRARLDLVPSLNMTKNVTVIQNTISESNNSGSGGCDICLPSGAGVGKYLSGNQSQQPVWKDFDVIISNFDDL